MSSDAPSRKLPDQLPPVPRKLTCPKCGGWQWADPTPKEIIYDAIRPHIGVKVVCGAPPVYICGRCQYTIGGMENLKSAVQEAVRENPRLINPADDTNLFRG